MGDFQEIQSVNRENNQGYDESIYSYVRWSESQKLVIVANFSSEKTSAFNLKIPSDVILKWNLKDGEYVLTDQLYLNKKNVLVVKNGEGTVIVEIAPSESFIYDVK